MSVINEDGFHKVFKHLLGDMFDRAFVVFRNYGPHLSVKFSSLLMSAVEQGEVVVAEVLGILEDHYKTHLSYQRPDVRGTVEDTLLGVNQTTELFERIYKETLGLQPTGQ